MSLRVGIDIGSTTVKVVVLDEQNKLLFRSYERHYSKTRERACQTLRSIGTTEDVAQWSAYLHCNFNNAAEAGKDTPYYAPLQKLAYRALGVLRCVYAVLLPLAFVWAVVRHLCALPMVLRRRTAGAALPWLLLFGLLAMAALRCGMIAFVEVSSFGIGTSTMYLSTVHPLLLLYTYGCLICYRNKGVITE